MVEYWNNSDCFLFGLVTGVMKTNVFQPYWKRRVYEAMKGDEFLMDVVLCVSSRLNQLWNFQLSHECFNYFPISCSKVDTHSLTRGIYWAALNRPTPEKTTTWKSTTKHYTYRKGLICHKLRFTRQFLAMLRSSSIRKFIEPFPIHLDGKVWELLELPLWSFGRNTMFNSWTFPGAKAFTSYHWKLKTIFSTKPEKWLSYFSISSAKNLPN